MDNQNNGNQDYEITKNPPVQDYSSNENSEDEKKENHFLGAVLGAGISHYLSRPQIMEQDNKYLQLKEQFKNDWLKKNNRKDFYSQDGLDFLHGSLDGKPSELKRLTEESFRQKHKGKANKYDKKAKKVSNPKKDPSIQLIEQEIREHVAARNKFAQNNGLPLDPNLSQMIKTNAWKEFIRKYPEKAKKYSEERFLKDESSKHQAERIKNAFEETLKTTQAETTRESQNTTQNLNTQRFQPARLQTVEEISSIRRPVQAVEELIQAEQVVEQKTLNQNYQKTQRRRSNRFNVDSLNRVHSATKRLLKKPGQEMKKAVKDAKKAFSILKLFMGPTGIIIIILLFLFLGSLLFIFSNIPTVPGSNGNGNISIPGLSITKSGPKAVGNGENIKDNIYVTYSGTAEIAEIEIIDKIPDGTTFVEEGTTGKYSKSPDGKEITWKLKDNTQSIKDQLITYSFDIVLHPNIPDTYVVNNVSPRLTSYGSGGGPPNTNTCSGKYKLDNPIGQNYGDPSCTFTKDDLYLMLKEKDPEFADDWFFNIIRCESSYNPNAFFGGSPDSAGAWGLYQMGRGKNGEFDHGDVVWQDQTINAITYNNRNIHKSFRYWACARYLWR